MNDGRDREEPESATTTPSAALAHCSSRPTCARRKSLDGVFEYDSTGPLGDKTPLADAFRARFGEAVI